MNARSKQIADAGRHLDVHWSSEELLLLECGLASKIARRRRLRRLAKLSILGTVAVVAAAIGLLYTGPAPVGGATVAPTRTAVAPRNPAAFRLRDGSQLEASENADWLERTPAADANQHVDLEVLRGRLRLSVVPHQPGEFRIRVGDVLVEVIGTILTVEREAGEVSVAVEHGRVRVTRAAEAPTILGAGERRTFTGSDASATVPDSEQTAEAPAPEAPSAAPTARPAQKGSAELSWQALAREGEYAAAYGKLHLDSVVDVPGDLLLAADVARLSGHPAQAVTPLLRVAREHASDPRAALAAFTLGRVYLEELGNPRDAATAFRLTRTLQPGGPMVESALAREVEARARAGETQTAKALALDYLSRYPNGSKRKLVQQHADAP